MVASILLSAQGGFIQGDKVGVLYDVVSSQLSLKRVVRNSVTVCLAPPGDDGKTVQIPNHCHFGASSLNKDSASTHETVS